MKKFIFYLSLIIAIILFVDILNKLMSDFSRLTPYGFGYITGEAIFLITFILLAYLTGKKKFRS